MVSEWKKASLYKYTIVKYCKILYIIVHHCQRCIVRGTNMLSSKLNLCICVGGCSLTERGQDNTQWPENQGPRE